MEKTKESANSGLSELKELLIQLNARLDRVEAENAELRDMFQKTMTNVLISMGKQDKIILILKELLRRKYLTFDSMELEEKELEELTGASHSTFFRWRTAEPPDNIKAHNRGNGRYFYKIEDLQAAIAAKKVPGCIGRLKLIKIINGFLGGASWPYNVEVDDELNIIN